MTYLICIVRHGGTMNKAYSSTITQTGLHINIMVVKMTYNHFLNDMELLQNFVCVFVDIRGVNIDSRIHVIIQILEFVAHNCWGYIESKFYIYIKIVLNIQLLLLWFVTKGYLTTLNLRLSKTVTKTYIPLTSMMMDSTMIS